VSEQIQIDDPAYASELPPVPAQHVVVPGVAQYIGRWRFVLVVAAVWLVAAAAGVGLYYWWYHSLDKAMPVFVVLVYLVACIVGSLLTAMVQDRPAIAATAVGLMSAPLASTAAGAALYGSYAFGWIAT
jgi:phosphoglycerol transferase MdoB-like AlkP superfamily enzyme